MVTGDRFLQSLGEGSGLHDVDPASQVQFPVYELAQHFHCQVLLLHSLNLGEELVGQYGDVGCVQSGGIENVHDLGRNDGSADDLLQGQVSLRRGLAGTGRALGKHRAHSLEEADFVTDAARLVGGAGKRERLGERQHGVIEAAMGALIAFLGRSLAALVDAGVPLVIA